MKKNILILPILALTFAACSLDKNVIEAPSSSASDKEIIKNAILNVGAKSAYQVREALVVGTGVTRDNIRNTWNNESNKLLPHNDLKQFTTSNLLAVIKLADAACNSMINNGANPKRAALYPGINFGAGNQWSDSNRNAQIAQLLVSNFMSRSATSEEISEIQSLINDLRQGETDNATMTQRIGRILCVVTASSFDSANRI